MKQFHKSEFKNNITTINSQIIIISFKEDDTYIVYSPQLEITGYGNSEKEAQESFEICLSEFFDYTTKKKTIVEELVHLGWELKKGTEKHPKKVNAPTWVDLFRKNPAFSDLMNSKETRTSQRSVAIPA